MLKLFSHQISPQCDYFTSVTGSCRLPAADCGLVSSHEGEPFSDKPVECKVSWRKLDSTCQKFENFEQQ